MDVTPQHKIKCDKHRWRHHQWPHRVAWGVIRSTSAGLNYCWCLNQSGDFQATSNTCFIFQFDFPDTLLLTSSQHSRGNFILHNSSLWGRQTWNTLKTGDCPSRSSCRHLWHPILMLITTGSTDWSVVQIESERVSLAVLLFEDENLQDFLFDLLVCCEWRLSYQHATHCTSPNNWISVETVSFQ